MRVNTINPCYSVKKNNTSPNFKAEVHIIPSSADRGQPERDRITLQKQTEDYKAKLEKAFPDDDNVLIVLQPDGFYCSENKTYYNAIKKFIGYKDPVRARTDILKVQNDLDEEDKLPAHVIKAIQNKDPEMMARLSENKISSSTNATPSEFLSDKINPILIEKMEDTLDVLEYFITEPPKEKQMLVEEKKSDMPLWFRVLFGDPGAPPIF